MCVSICLYGADIEMGGQVACVHHVDRLHMCYVCFCHTVCHLSQAFRFDCNSRQLDFSWDYWPGLREQGGGGVDQEPFQKGQEIHSIKFAPVEIPLSFVWIIDGLPLSSWQNM